MKYESSYLAHHGIKGQKWGVRRYQNSDGSYTNIGKARRGSKKRRRMTDGQKALLGSIASLTLYGGVIAGANYANSAMDFDSTCNSLVGQGMRDTINGISDASDKYAKAYKAINDSDTRFSRYDAQAAKMKISYNQGVSKGEVSIAERRYRKLESKKTLLKISKRRRDQLSKAADNLEKLRKANAKLQDNADKLKDTISKHTSNSSERSYSNPFAKENTAHTKSKDREAEFKKKGVKVGSYADEQRKYKDLQKKVAKAQQDGTLTPEMINELQEANARRRMAKEKEGIAHGFLCFITRDSNYLAHHGIKGTKWRVKRY